jgi:predicted nucleic acid-binding protein
MTGKAFVDTNILVYAHDRGAGAKFDRARQLIAELWEDRSGVLSTQVLQEFYINVRRKAARPISRHEARSVLEDYMTWDVVVNTGHSILSAVELERRHDLSFWDALIVQAAKESGADRLFSEDFQHGRRFGHLRVFNPFLG